MKVTGKPVAVGVGWFFIGFALISALLILPSAKQSQSPVLYVFLIGGLFVGIPAVLGIAVVCEYLHNRNRARNAEHR